MKQMNLTTRLFCLMLLTAMICPSIMLADSNLSFSELSLDDGKPCKLPLQNEKLAITYDNGKAEFDNTKKVMAFSMGTTITIKAKDGEKITGVFLKTTTKIKDKKKDFYSSNIGKCRRGLWTGEANTVTIKCLQDCDISYIRAAFSSDQPEAYAAKEIDNYWHYDSGPEANSEMRPMLSLYYNGNKSLFEEYLEDTEWPKLYSIDGNTYYPAWYGDKIIGRFYIDSSFESFHPKRTSHWFEGYSCNITGIQNLNTSEVVDMSYMFANYNFELKDDLSSTYNDYDKKTFIDPQEAFYSSIFECLDFSKVQDVSNMFSGCGMKRFALTSNNISNINNSKDLFNNSNVEMVRLTSSDLTVKDGFFNGLGSVDNPCLIDAPDGYDFGTETSAQTFEWKNGFFKGFQLQTYVICKKLSIFEEYMYGSVTKSYNIEFYYDTKRYVREKKGYKHHHILYDEDLEGGYTESLVVKTFDLNEGSEEPLWLNFFEERFYDSEMRDNFFSTIIKFDKSFTDCRPKSTYRWFDFGGLTAKSDKKTHECRIYFGGIYVGNFDEGIKIEGLEYLNTSETTNTERMFYGLINMPSLDLSKQDFSKVTNSKNMLANCYSLKNLTVNKTCENLDPTAFLGVGYYQPCIINLPIEISFGSLNFNDSFEWKNGRFILSDKIENKTNGYAVINDNTMSFYYDDRKGQRTGSEYDLTRFFETDDFKYLTSGYDSYYISWNSISEKQLIQNVVIDPSFIKNIPGETIGWFFDASNLDSVQGIKYLRSTNMHSMFSKCTNLKTIDLSECDMSETFDTEDWFYGCTSLTDIILPNTCTIIGTSAFEGCTSLPSITIPGKVTSIGNSAFNHCDNLTLVIVENPTPVTITESTFSNRRNATLIVPIGAKAAYLAAEYWKEFKEIKETPAIIFADANVKAICVANWDTNGDGELDEMEAAAVTSIGTVFKKSKITSFNELQYFTGLSEISEGAFSGSSVSEIILPKSISSLKKDAFLNCKSLTSLFIPTNLQSIELNALSGCTAMISITVDGANDAFCDIDGVLFTKDGKSLLQFPAAKAAEYTVPEETEIIARDAFYMSKLESVSLPSSLKELAYDAFGYSTHLTDLVIPEGVTDIGDYILDACTSLKTLHIPSTVTAIGQRICNSCKVITDVYNYGKYPFDINSNNFNAAVYQNATLHVPYGTKEAYAATEGWSSFINITDDISANTLMVDDLTVSLGHSKELVINLANSQEVDAVQFDFMLPNGLSVATDEGGEYIVKTTGRSQKLGATCEKMADGNYRIVLYSANRSSISSGEGAILKIKINCPKETVPGNYNVDFSSIYISRVAGNVSVNENSSDFSSSLTVMKISTLMGDADGDYTINVTDVMVIVDYILGRNITNFIFANSDMDKDGIVNITDAMNVVNIILGKSQAQIPSAARTNEYDLFQMSPGEQGCYIHTNMGAMPITAVQMDVALPDECSLKAASLMGKTSLSHKIMTNHLNDNRYRIIIFSANKATLESNAPVLSLEIEGRGGFISAEKILCTDENSTTVLSHDISTVATGINAIYADTDDAAPVYNISGQRVSNKQKGLVITKGLKAVVR